MVPILHLLIALALLLCPALASAQVALVQSNTSTSGTMWTTGSFAEQLCLPGAVTPGNTLVAWTSWGNSARTMTADIDAVGAMTTILNKGATATNGDPAVQMFARVATTTEQCVTATISGNDANGIQAFSLAEFSGMAATLSTSGGAGVSATTSAEITPANANHDSGADLTPDTPHNVMLGGSMTTTTSANWADDGFTMLTSTGTIRHGYLIQSSAGDWVPSTSPDTRVSETGLVNLDGAAVAGGSCRGGLLLMGVGKCD